VIDYYKIVARSVAALDPDTEAARQALYERARAGLAKQLCLKTPPVPSDSIRAELSALEDAITKVESEAWSRRYEIKDKKEASGSDNARARPTRSAAWHFVASALLLAAGAGYFILWMRFSGSGSVATALVLLLVFALPAAFVFVFAIYPIMSPLLWPLRWLNKKSLQRLVGGEMAANAAGATVLSALLCAAGAFEAPQLFSWWAAGWCWIGWLFLLTLDPGSVGNVRAWLSNLQRSKAKPAEGPKSPPTKGFLRWGSSRKLTAPVPESTLSNAA
jgi:hypothetical protein